MHDHLRFCRRVQECLNCWPIFDGDSEIVGGMIDICPTLTIGESDRVAMEIRPNFRGTYLVLAGAVLEPFWPQANSHKPISIWQGRIDISTDVVRMTLPDLVCPADFPPGRHQVRACLLLNEHLAFLYRDVYLVPGDSLPPNS
jgi:hypothetical protein